MIDASSVIADLAPALNAATTSDLAFWTTTELYGYADENLKRLARQAGVFAERTQTSPGAVSSFSLGSRDIAILQAAWNGVVILPTTLRDLDALDTLWADAAAATPRRYLADAGLAQRRLYPPAASGSTLDLITFQSPADVTSGAPQCAAPPLLQDWLYFVLLAEARGRNGEGAMPDVAAQARQFAALLETAARHYWGPTL
jgi:hypothetical protein